MTGYYFVIYLKMWCLLLFHLGFFYVEVKSMFHPLQNHTLPVPPDGNLGTPLFLTPVLEKGNYKKAQRLSKVTPNVGNITSYSGFFTVNKNCGSNLFFWFFPAQKNWKDAPLLLWLDGGPGSSSMHGVFERQGPFSYSKKGLQKRKYSWNVENNYLIIDQPVGTGYSFTRKNCYPVNETAVGEDLYQAVLQFHQLFPHFQKQKFFISGSSYAGHYIPALGHTIRKYNPSAKVKINLTAMLIGNGWFDPVTQADYADFLYQHGFIDDSAKEIFESFYNKFKLQISAKNFIGASNTINSINTTLRNEYVGPQVIYENYLYIQNKVEDRQNWPEFIQSYEVRKALKVGCLPFQSGDKIFQSLALDLVQSVKPWVEELLEEYPIVFYNGQLDIVCGYPMMIKFLRSLNWSGESQYLNATRTKWCVGKNLVGYYKGVHNLYDVLVRDAGHQVPFEQPLWGYLLVNSVTSGTPDNPLHALKPCDSTGGI